MWMTEYFSRLHFDTRHSSAPPSCGVWAQVKIAALSLVTEKAEKLLWKPVLVGAWGAHNRISLTNFCGSLAEATILCMASPSPLNESALLLPLIQLAASDWALQANNQVHFNCALTETFFFPWGEGLHLWGSLCDCSRWNVWLQGYKYRFWNG